MPSNFEEMEREDENIAPIYFGNCSGPIWQLDSETDSCMLCSIIFTFTRRKHHCRICGKIFCGDCAKHRIPIPFLNNLTARVCLLCFKNQSKSTCLGRDDSKDSHFIHPVHVPYTLPSVVFATSNGGRFMKSDLKEADMTSILSDEKSSTPVSFVLNPNLVAMVKIIKLSKFPVHSYWLVVTHGLKVVGQDEVVVILERQQTESIPVDLFLHFLRLYKEASFGYHQHHMSCSEPNRDGGRFFLYLDVLRLTRRSSDINDPRNRHHHHHHPLHPFHEVWEKFPFVPRQSFLLSILMNREEFGAARRLPLRVMLRAASDQGYYPYPLVSKRLRRSIFPELSRSVVENYLDVSGSVGDRLSGLKITITGQSNILLEVPRSAYKKLMRCLNETFDTIFLVGDFNEDSCRHLTCDEDNDKLLVTSSNSCSGLDSEYKKECNGASFLIIKRSQIFVNCSFKVIEDGAVLELNVECFDQLKSSLRNMADRHFESLEETDKNVDDVVGGDDDVNGSQYFVGDDDDDEEPKNQTFTVVWTNKEEIMNIGVMSEVDGRSLAGVRSMRIQVTSDEEGVRFLERSSSSRCFHVQCGVPIVRWLEVFFLEESIPEAMEDDFNVMSFVQKVGCTCCKVLQRHASLLDERISSLGVRVSVHEGREVLIDAASSGKPIPGECLNELQEVLTKFTFDVISSFHSRGIIITTEFLFRVLSVNSTLRNCPELVVSD